MVDGPMAYYKLTSWAFGSGELKNKHSEVYVGDKTETLQNCF